MDTSLGTVRSKVVNGEALPIVYVSRKLLQHEKSFAIVEKECFAITCAVPKLQSYLLGRRFPLMTDHTPLIYMWGYVEDQHNLSTPEGLGGTLQVGR
jgi:hypothetical protein